MDNNQPILSICIPTFNRARYLRVSLESILEEIKGHEEEVEIVVSDNASTDETEEVVASYKKNNPVIKYHRNAENKTDENFLIASKLSTGRFIWLLGDNRILNKNSVTKILDEIKSGYNLIITNFSLFSVDENKMVKNKYYNINSEIFFDDHNLLLKYFGIELGHISQLIFKRDIMDRTNYEEYMQCVPSGWAFLYLIYKGVFNGTNAIFLNEPFYIKKAKVVKQDWTKPFVIGSSFILRKIEDLGYDNGAIAHARNKVIKSYIIPHIIYDKKNRQTKLSKYIDIYNNYRASTYFWFFCLPVIVIPSPILKTLIGIKRIWSRDGTG